MSNTTHAFIPNRLNIDIKPELSIFPFNILFMSYTEKDGQLVTGTSIYSPDISTYINNSYIAKMIYRNHYGLNSKIIIKYEFGTGGYEAQKFVNDVIVQSAFGKDWKNFFINLTMSGIHNGEACEFENVGK